jgi:hypothetical protein
MAWDQEPAVVKGSPSLVQRLSWSKAKAIGLESRSDCEKFTAIYTFWLIDRMAGRRQSSIGTVFSGFYGGCDTYRMSDSAATLMILLLKEHQG